MSASESDLVLSAIRRGEETLPKLKAATGIGYARLQTVLYNLEFERCSISRSESVEGFDRYYPSSAPQAEKKHIHAAPAVPPSYNLRTNAAVEAQEAALEQRAAPYCIGCQGVCMLNGAEEGRRRWRCGTCDLAFPGSLMEVEVAHMIEMELKCEDCGGPRSPGSASRCRDCYQKKADARVSEIVEAGASPVTNYKIFDSSEQVEPEPKTCWCGRKIEAGYGTHRGTHRGGLKAKKEAAQNGGGVLAAGLVTPSAPKVDVVKVRKVTGAKSAVSDGFVRDAFCLAQCHPPVSHHFQCTYFPANRSLAPRRIEIDTDQGRPIETSPAGDELGLQESYQAILGELCSDRDALGRVIEIFKREKETGVRITETTRRSSPTSIQPAWPKYFEEDTDIATGEGQVGMGLFYLLSILHDSMEEHEKQAVWTLVQYMKRMQAASEAAKADKLALST